MIKRIMLTCLAAMSCTLISAEANEGFYVGGLAGANFLQTESARIHHVPTADNSHKTIKVRARSRVGYDFGITAGYAWHNGIRLESEVGYRQNRLTINARKLAKHLGQSVPKSHLNLSVWSYMGNLLYDFHTCSGLKPFVGIGVGYGHQNSTTKVKIDGKKFHSHKNHQQGFAWQLLTGVAYPLCENIDISLEYRFVNCHEKAYDHRLDVGLKHFF